MKRPEDFFKIYQQSAWEKDITRMIELYDDNVVVFDMWDRGYQSGLDEWSGEIKNWLGSLGEEKVRVSFEMINLRETGDAAFASALVSFQAIAVDDTVLRGMKNRITIGLVRKGDRWKVIHQHTSAPVNGDLQAILVF